MRRQTRNVPNLDRYVADKPRRYVTYIEGASLYRMNYYTYDVPIHSVNIVKDSRFMIA